MSDTNLNTNTNISKLKKIIILGWSREVGSKVRRYVNMFSGRLLIGEQIRAQVEGNHGIYTVTIENINDKAHSACSCYIGKHGGCHHCHALALTFLNDPQSFREIVPVKPAEINVMTDLTNPKETTDLHDYLKSVTLDSLIKQLKKKGITQKAFAESIGMNSRHLSTMKSNELRNRYNNGLGAAKLACLWVLERATKKPK